jgi:hypothetical protein
MNSFEICFLCVTKEEHEERNHFSWHFQSNKPKRAFKYLDACWTLLRRAIATDTTPLDNARPTGIKPNTAS